MKVEMKWGRWLAATGVFLAIALFTHWSTISLVALGLVAFTGAIRVWIMFSAPGFERRVAKMPPEQRERFLAGLSEEERQKWHERLKNIDAA